MRLEHNETYEVVLTEKIRVWDPHKPMKERFMGAARMPGCRGTLLVDITMRPEYLIIFASGMEGTARRHQFRVLSALELLAEEAE